MEQFLLTLRFYGTGGFYITMGDFSDVHKSTARLIIKRTTEAICQLREQYIFMPQEEEQVEIKQKFYRIARFPKVVGSIDGTHIRIQSPGEYNIILKIINNGIKQLLKGEQMQKYSEIGKGFSL